MLFNPVSGVPLSQRVPGPLERHPIDARAAGSLVQRRGRRLRYGDRTFRHFQPATASTDFVLGEFPWRVERRGSGRSRRLRRAAVHAVERRHEEEATWSLGEYTTGEQIWKAFALPGDRPTRSACSRTSPRPTPARPRATCEPLRCWRWPLLLVLAGRALTAAREQVFRHDYAFQPGDRRGRLRHRAVHAARRRARSSSTIDTSVNNSWLGFDLALINREPATA